MKGIDLFIIIMGVEYLVAALLALWAERPWFALTLLCYGVANIGLSRVEGH